LSGGGVGNKAPDEMEPFIDGFLSPRNAVFMGSQKNLSHSSLIESAAPPRRARRRPGNSRFFCLGRRASSLEEVNAARGGLVGGDGSPEEGTSGIPLGPCSQGSAVVEALELGGSVDEVGGGEDVDVLDDVLAVVIT
jgi:hypothetical protein